MVKRCAAGQEELQLIMLKNLRFEAPSESLRGVTVGVLKEVIGCQHVKSGSPTPLKQDLNSWSALL